MEFPRRPFQDEENPSLARVCWGFDSQPLHPFAAQKIQVHLVLCVPREIARLGATGIELVLKVGPFPRNRCDLILE